MQTLSVKQNHVGGRLLLSLCAELHFKCYYHDLKFNLHMYSKGSDII